MNREEIIRMAREAGFKVDWQHADVAEIKAKRYEYFAELVAAREREKVAAWMMRQGYATGHGDTVEDLLQELDWQIREQEREACAEMVWPTQQIKVWSDKEINAMTGAFNRAQEKHGWYETLMAVGAAALKNRAAAIRARSEQCG
jgi:hypothetical protein